MLKINLFDQIICRTAAFGINQTLEEVWEALKTKIQESSPEFFAIIQNLSYGEIANQNEKTKFTIYKYYNRAKYRSTPFGSFAAVSLVPVHHEPKPIELQAKLLAHHFYDWAEKEQLSTQPINPATSLQSNSSIYFTGQQIRYIKLTQGTFELSSVDCFAELNAIVRYCKHKTTSSALLAFMSLSFNLPEKSTNQLLTQMIQLQLLQTSLQPNITGEDYFTRLQLSSTPKPSNYIICERALKAGNFPSLALKEIPAMVNFFAKHCAAPQSKDLQEFKKAFLRRFEQQEISLAQAMDPELGIGYGELAQPAAESTLVGELKNTNPKTTQPALNFGPFQQFLLQKIISKEPIDLAAYITEQTPSATLPNTFSVIFHLHQNRPVLAHSGGVTANALLGRFTHVSKAYENLGKQISQIETSANSEVLFFDIAYQAEKKVDNVNRRKHLYPFELPILSWSETATPLDFNDILVSVLNNKVILTSKKLGKRLIPRIPSAYNYTRSDLAVFRFLCDIQSQNLLTNLTLKLQDLFPGLAHYPSINYKNIIVSAASFLFKKQSITSLQALKDWLTKNNILGLFKAGQSDQSLCFDTTNEKDLSALLTYSKQQNADFYLTEALQEDKDGLKDEKGNIYCPQYIASFYHTEEIYPGAQPNLPQKPINHLPLDQWLYFEIYTHPSRSNELLTGKISKFITGNRKLIKKWFFIRYSDPAPHLRLRIQPKAQKHAQTLILALNKLIYPEMEKNIITDYQLKTYRPETQRYGHAGMAQVEQFFYNDSKYVLKLLKQNKDEQQLIIKAIQQISRMSELVQGELPTQIQFAAQMAQSFAKEMNLGPQEFKKINLSYNSIKKTLQAAISRPKNSAPQQWEQSFVKVIGNCQNSSQKEKMLADLIHMHINRLFTSDQRLQETISYHYLKATLQTRLAILKAEGEAQ